MRASLCGARKPEPRIYPLVAYNAYSFLNFSLLCFGCGTYLRLYKIFHFNLLLNVGWENKFQTFFVLVLLLVRFALFSAMLYFSELKNK